MGPNVKFVSAITDAFSNKKNGGQFFPQKKNHTGGGRGIAKIKIRRKRLGSRLGEKIFIIFFQKRHES